jgi:hypothetical protein
MRVAGSIQFLEERKDHERNSEKMNMFTIE